MNQTAHLITICSFVLLAGCTLFDTSNTNDNTQAQISVQSSLISQSEIQIRIENGQEIRRFSNSDFKERENPTIEKATPVVDLSSSGVMNIEFVFADVNSRDTLSNGTIQIELKEDWIHTLYFMAESGEADPTEGCFGCLDTFSFEIDTASLSPDSPFIGDSLYVILSGNSINEPVIY
jgi:hypothetical protein